MKVACVLVTHFSMKVELRRHPEFKGSAVIIAQEYGSEQVVVDSSPEAQGVVGGMPLQEALACCKHAQLLQADWPCYEAIFDEMIDSLEKRSPLVERAELGLAYVGLDGLEPMYGGEARLITALLGVAPYQLNPRIGVAEGKFPAYVAAVTADGGSATKVPGDAAQFLKDLSVGLLPLSWENKARLRRFGLDTLGQLAGLSVGSLQAQFGWDGKRFWELANGIDNSPLVPRQLEIEVSEGLTFPSPAVTLQEILTAIETLLGQTFARPEVRGRYVRGITIESNVFRHSPWIKRFTFKKAIGSKDKARFIVKNAIESASLPGPLEDMTLTLTGLAGESGIQSSMYSDVRKREQLREMMRQMEARLGCKPPIYQMREIEPWSRIPERRQALVLFDP